MIGTGVVFHVPSFFKELAELEKKGLNAVTQRIFVSDRCHVDFDLHAAVDGLEEVELGERKIGTTGRGIGPSYSTKAAVCGGDYPSVAAYTDCRYCREAVSVFMRSSTRNCLNASCVS